MEIMKKMRRKFSNEFKAQVAIEALKERETLSKLALRFELHQNQISQWKQEFLANSSPAPLFHIVFHYPIQLAHCMAHHLQIG